ncbi:MAG: tetraacyldisaccharide 4'-kinase [bacterium]|nr:tetraacyldisaccharide 4'-kinase [bacterium]
MPLYFLEILYKLGVSFHNLKKGRKIPASVISIGNLTTGGTGKTEIAIKIAEYLEESEKCAILSRGYKGKREGLVGQEDSFLDVGDEPAMMKIRTNVPILVGKDRVKQAKWAIENLRVKRFVLDDGFQYRGLEIDQNILLINGNNPFGNGHLLPCGILREPLSSIKRADIILITKKRNTGLIETIRRFNQKAPIFFSSYKPKALIDTKDRYMRLETIKNKRVLALSGVADPAYFEEELKLLGASIEPLRFPDHHPFSEKDIEAIKRKAEGFDVVVSTLKDKVRLLGRLEALFLVIELMIDDGFFEHIKELQI